MPQKFGLHHVGTTDNQIAIAALDRACWSMIREDRDQDKPCILCGKHKERYDN